MSKGKICAVVTAVIIMLSFTLSLYLMSTVNPPPLKMADPGQHELLEDLEVSMISSEEEEEEEDEPNIEDPIDNHWKSFAPFYRYATENITANFSEAENSPSSAFNNFRRFVYPPIYPPRRTTQPADFNKETIKTSTKLNSNFFDMYRVIKNVDLNNKTESVKDLRRSIHSPKNKIVDGNSGYINIQILDNNGKPRIEIKLNNEDSSSNGKALKTISNYKMNVQRNDAPDEMGELGHKTVIKILPNQSLVVDSDGTINNILKQEIETVKLYDKIPIEKQSKPPLKENTIYTIIPNKSRHINVMDMQNVTKNTDTPVKLTDTTKTNYGLKNSSLVMARDSPVNITSATQNGTNSSLQEEVSNIITREIKNVPKYDDTAEAKSEGIGLILDVQNDNLEKVKSIIDNSTQIETQDKKDALLNLRNLEYGNGTAKISNKVIKELSPALKNITLPNVFIIRNLNKQIRPSQCKNENPVVKETVLPDFENITTEGVKTNISDKVKKVIYPIIRQNRTGTINHTRPSNSSIKQSVIPFGPKDKEKLTIDSKNFTLDVVNDAFLNITAVQYLRNDIKSVNYLKNNTNVEGKYPSTINNETQKITDSTVTENKRVLKNDSSNATILENGIRETTEKIKLKDEMTSFTIEDEAFGIKVTPFTEPYKVNNTVERSIIRVSNETKIITSSSSTARIPPEHRPTSLNNIKSFSSR